MQQINLGHAMRLRGLISSARMQIESKPWGILEYNVCWKLYGDNRTNLDELLEGELRATCNK